MIRFGWNRNRNNRSLAAPLGPQPARRRGARFALVALEVLEDRVLLSATAPSADWTYEQWRDATFSIDTLSVSTGEVETPSAEGGAGAQSQQSGALIGLPDVFDSTSYRGTGYSVVVIDTGIDYNHTSLGGGWGNRVIAGYDFVNNDADPIDDHGHGTHVAGIIGSSHATYAGLAPDVNLIALKVLDASGSGSFGDVEDALQWTIANQATYNIVAVNMSLGAGNYQSDPFTFLNDEFTTLKSQDVFIAVSSGNSFYTYNSTPGLGAPAISQHVVAVGAVWDANVGSVNWSSGARDYTTAPDRITSFTQRSSQLDILAPGAMLTNTYMGGGFATMAGTSMAAPVIAGAAALLHQALEDTGQSSQANQDDILALMQDTGVSINDGDDEDDNVTNTGLNFKRLDLAAVMDYVLGNLPDYMSRSGTVVDVYGTAGDDTFAFSVGSQLAITVGGELTEIDPATITTLNFHGGDGADTITINGTAAYEELLLEVGSFVFESASLTLTAADMENVSVFSGGGADTATFYDSPGKDKYTGKPTFALLEGPGFSHYAEGFARVDAYVTAGSGDDRAFLQDGNGDDVFTADPVEARLTGPGYDHHVYNFDRLHAFADKGGFDRADFYDSAANDQFIARSIDARLQGPGFNNYARGFEQAYAYATAGGTNDRGTFYDSLGNDTMVATPSAVSLSGTGFYCEASGFDRVNVFASGGYDDAYLYDSAGNDLVSVFSDRVIIKGSGFNTYALDFEYVRATASLGGTNTIDFDAFDSVFEAVGDWVWV